MQSKCSQATRPPFGRTRPVASLPLQTPAGITDPGYNRSPISGNLQSGLTVEAAELDDPSVSAQTSASESASAWK